MLRTFETVKPIFLKPSQATLRRIETVLTITLAAQTIGLAIRSAF